jgi:CMP/dCMP kinase
LRAFGSPRIFTIFVDWRFAFRVLHCYLESKANDLSHFSFIDEFEIILATLTVAIDGPAAAGKTTLAKAIAGHFSLLHIDSGAVYRAIGYKIVRSGITTENPRAIIELTEDSIIEVRFHNGNPRLLLDGDDITEEIRTPDVTLATAQAAVIADVRRTLTKRLREMQSARGTVMDGRDIGTNVLPNASHKIYLDARLDVRARRRWSQEIVLSPHITLDRITTLLHERDTRDLNRPHNPLIKADDATTLDTSDMSMDEVFARAKELVLLTD